MAFNVSNLKPVQLSAEQTAQVAASLGSQDVSRRTPKVLDPNFPLWETLVNDKALIYVPNFTRTNPETGELELAVERAYIHDVRLGNSFMQVRSTQGLTDLPEVLGISGQDPLAEAEQLNWELYNEKVAVKVAQLGVSDARSDDEAMKAARRSILNEFTTKQAREFVLFPIIHIETEKSQNGMNDPRKIVTKDGKVVTKVYYYQVSMATFEKQFKTIIDTLEVGQTLGGQFYVFSYDTGKRTEELDNPKRDSGLAFTATLSAMSQIPAESRAALDDLAKDFTLEKARETVISFMLLSDEQHADIAQQAMKPVQEQLDTLRFAQGAAAAKGQSGLPAAGQGQTPEDVMASFGATEATPNVEQPTLSY